MEKKTIRLGKFFGNWLLLELDESNFPPFTPEIWLKRWQNWLKEERKDAVEEYKESQLLNNINRKTFTFKFWNMWK